MEDLLKTTKDIADETVVEHVLNGKVDEYEIIVRRYNDYLYKIGRTYGFNHSDTEDLMQETYVNAYKYLNTFKGKAAFKTWLVRIMVNQCYQKTQKASFKNENLDANQSEASSIKNHQKEDGNQTIQNRELKEQLERAIAQLPEKYKLVFTLRELSGMSTKETAKSLKISSANVKIRLKRAKKMLRDTIEQVYNPKDVFGFNLIYCDGIAERVLQAIKAL